MVKRLLLKLLGSRLHLKDKKLDELGEIYLAMLLRGLALSIVGIFIPIYLYDIGYSISQILLFFVFFFAARTVADVVSGYMVAAKGPKHTMLASYMLQIVAIIFMISLEAFEWPLFLPAVFWAAANSLFFIAFHVEFSKIKHKIKSGSEIGIVNAAERIGGALGPIVGGVLATLLGAESMFIAAIFMMLFGLIPLFLTPEPVKTHQTLHFRALDLRTVKRDLLSYVFFTAENNLRLVLWPLFLTIFLFSGAVYVKVGGIVSFGVFVSVIASLAIGKLIDAKKGRLVLKLGTIFTALAHLLKIFTTSVPYAAGITVASEVSSVAQRMSYTKGWYDAADDHPGFRIVYMVTMEAVGSYAKFIVWLELFLLSHYIMTRQLFIIGFMIAAFASIMVMMTQKFKSLEGK
jgi:MFS family permease